jgi:hypothetical protein
MIAHCTSTHPSTARPSSAASATLGGELSALTEAARAALQRLVYLAHSAEAISTTAMLVVLEPAIAHLAEYHRAGEVKLKKRLVDVRFGDLLLNHFERCAHRQLAQLEHLLGELSEQHPQDTVSLGASALVLLAEFEAHAEGLRRVMGSSE